jgi:hypothetical protein
MSCLSLSNGHAQLFRAPEKHENRENHEKYEAGAVSRGMQGIFCCLSSIESCPPLFFVPESSRENRPQVLKNEATGRMMKAQHIVVVPWLRYNMW